MKRETLESGVKRVTVDLDPLELQCLSLAADVYGREDDACRLAVEEAGARHKRANAAHRKQLDFVLLQRGIEVPQNARVRADFENSSVVWETDPEQEQEQEQDPEADGE